MNIKLSFVILILTLFLIMTLQNTESATFKILFWQITMSRIVFMYLSALLGFLAGYAVAKIINKKRNKMEGDHDIIEPEIKI